MRLSVIIPEMVTMLCSRYWKTNAVCLPIIYKENVHVSHMSLASKDEERLLTLLSMVVSGLTT